jgi:hypothetical protein
VFFRRSVVEAEKLDSSISIVLDYEYWLRLGTKYRFAHVPRLWAVDRNQPGRKILVLGDELDRQRRALRRQYGLDMGITYSAQRVLDMILYGLPCRFKGLFGLRSLHQAGEDAFAIPLQFEPVLTTIWRQLWRRNRQPGEGLRENRDR